MRALSVPGETFVGFSDRSSGPTPKVPYISSADTKTSLSFPPFLILLYHTSGKLSRGRSGLHWLPDRAHKGNPTGLGKTYPIGEARTFHEKNRIWGTRPENRPWRPGAAGSDTRTQVCQKLFLSPQVQVCQKMRTKKDTP